VREKARERERVGNTGLGKFIAIQILKSFGIGITLNG
jgi:hypothetical protein